MSVKRAAAAGAVSADRAAAVYALTTNVEPHLVRY